MVLITRDGEQFSSRVVSMVQVYSCVGGHDPELNAALMKTFSRGNSEKCARFTATRTIAATAAGSIGVVLLEPGPALIPA